MWKAHKNVANSAIEMNIQNYEFNCNIVVLHKFLPNIWRVDIEGAGEGGGGLCPIQQAQ